MLDCCMFILHLSTGGDAKEERRPEIRDVTVSVYIHPKSIKRLVSGVVNADLLSFYLVITKVDISDLQKWFTHDSQVLEKPQVIGKCFYCRHTLKQTAHFLQELFTVVAGSLMQ